MVNVIDPLGERTDSIFADVNVRKAIAMGVDRQRIVDNFYADGATVPTHFTPCSLPNGCVGDAWYDFDPDAAKALLAEAVTCRNLVWLLLKFNHSWKPTLVLQPKLL